MNNKLLKIYEEIALRNGLSFNAEAGVVHGVKNQYNVAVFQEQNGNQNLMTILFTVSHNGTQLTKEDQKALKKATAGSKAVGVINVSSNKLKVTVPMKGNAEKTVENVREALEIMTNVLAQNSYINCCNTCKEAVDTDAYMLQGGISHLCPDCYSEVKMYLEQNAQMIEAKKENLIGGIVGAVIGSLIGVASILLLSQMGYVAALSGMVMAICCLKGFEIAGGKLSKRGIIISVIVMIVMTFIANQIDWAILIAREFYVTVGEAFWYVNAVADPTSYIANLILLYLFVVLGAVPTINSARKNEAMKGVSYKL